MKRIFLLALAIAAIGTASFAIGGDPAAALKSITEYRTKYLADMRAANKPLDQNAVNAMNAKVTEMATEAIKGVEVGKIDPKQGLDYAQLFQMVDKNVEACQAAEMFLATNPTAAEKYRAQSIMLASCNENKEGARVMEILKQMQPASNAVLYGLAATTAGLYADTINETVGLQAALATIRYMETNVKLSTPANDQEKARMKSTLASMGQAKAELLNDAGKKQEALDILNGMIAELGGPTVPEARSLNGLKTRMTLIGSPATALNFERGYGEWKGLDALKGKVVILDFFAHWCGPCIRSFPDMKQLYADNKAKGLEIVGITTYYGYYKTENTAKRDMPKDTEFAKMGEFLNEHKLPWPVIYGERSNFDAYGVTGIPHVAVIDREGKVHKIKVGYSPALFAEFKKEIEKLLK